MKLLHEALANLRSRLVDLDAAIAAGTLLPQQEAHLVSLLTQLSTSVESECSNAGMDARLRGTKLLDTPLLNTKSLEAGEPDPAECSAHSHAAPLAVALRRSEATRKALVSAIPDLMVRIDKNGILRDFLPPKNFSALVLPDKQEMRGRSIFDILPTAIAQERMFYVTQALQTGLPQSYEYEVSLGHERRYQEARLVVIPDSGTEGGEPDEVLVIVRDITDRRLVEDALRHTAEQLRQQAQREQLLNRLTTQIRNSLDCDTILTTAVQEIQRFLQVDRCAFTFFHYEAPEPYWHIAKECHAPDRPSLQGCYSARTVGAWVDRLRHGEVLRLDRATAIEDSAWRRWIKLLRIKSVLIIPMQTQSGLISMISCSHSQAVRFWTDEEVEMLQAVMVQLVIALNQSDLYTQARSKAQDLEHALSELKAAQTQLIQAEKMSSLGQLVAGVAHEINNPVNFITGNLKHAGLYIQDLLHLIRLYQSHSSQSIPAIEEYTAAIELEFMLDDLPKLLNSMRVGADRIQKIVASLRTFSRMDEAECKAVDIHEGIDSTLMILQHRLKAHSNRDEIPVFKHYGILPLVECYAGQLNQVFMNILSNAIDAIDEVLRSQEFDILQDEENSQNGNFQNGNSQNGNSQNGSGTTHDRRSLPAPSASHIPTFHIPTPQIHIYTELVHTSPAPTVRIRIADTGAGMTEAVRQRLFDPFFTTKPVGKGTGMGLSISYQIVTEKHRGQLYCVSAPGNGAEFVIEIPLRQTACHFNPTPVRARLPQVLS